MITEEADYLRRWKSVALALALFALTLTAGPTTADAQLPGPAFNLHVYDDAVFTWDWPAPSTITVSIDDQSTGPGIDFVISETGAADSGLFIAFAGQFDVEPGDYVEVTDGTTTLSHIVQLVTITDLDPAADRIVGTADSGAVIDIGVGGPDLGVTPYQQFVTADASGVWVAELAPYDLLDGAWLAAHRQHNGNTSMFVLDPTFSVLLPGSIHSWGWLPNLDMTLTVDDPATTVSPDYTANATSPPAGQGFGIDLHGAFEVQRGHIVTMTDGSSTVVHVVRDLNVTRADLTTGEVAGTAEPGSIVEVRADGGSGFASEEVVADTAGDWSAGPFEELVFVEAVQSDVVGNSTVVAAAPTAEFGGHDYQYFPESRSWHEAVAICESLDAHLVTIGSAEEDAFVFELSHLTWLGATDELVESEWRWVTGEPFSYTNWAPGEPNNMDGFPPHGPEHYLTYAFPFDGRWKDVPAHSVLPFICESDGLAVDIDIKPGSMVNPVNLKSNHVPVAVLTSAEFDATVVDPLSVRFGPLAAIETHRRGHLVDVDGDGDNDLILHFGVAEAGIRIGDTEACVSGITFGGEAIRGCDTITVKG